MFGCSGDMRDILIYTPSTPRDFHFTARHFWGFPLYRPLEIKRSLSNASTVTEN